MTGAGSSISVRKCFPSSLNYRNSTSIFFYSSDNYYNNDILNYLIAGHFTPSISPFLNLFKIVFLCFSGNPNIFLLDGRDHKLFLDLSYIFWIINMSN